MAIHWAMFLPLPVIVIYAAALLRAETTKQREFATAGLFLAFALIGGVAALVRGGS